MRNNLHNLLVVVKVVVSIIISIVSKKALGIMKTLPPKEQKH